MVTIPTTRRGSVLRNAQGTQELREIVEKVAPKANPDSYNEAVSKLQTAIDGFRQGYPYVEGIDGNYRVRGSVSKHREALAELSKSLNKSIALVKGLPLQAHAALSHKLGPKGKLIIEMNRWAIGASEEYRKAVRSKDHPEDDNPAYLAFAVARVLQDTLRVKVTLRTVTISCCTIFIVPARRWAYRRQERVTADYMLAQRRAPRGTTV